MPGAAENRPQRRENTSNLPLIVGVVLALLIMAGGGLALFYVLQGEKPAGVEVAVDAHAAPAEVPATAVPEHKPLDLSWLSPQSDLIVHFRPADLLKSAFAQWVIDAANGRKAFDESQESIRNEMGVVLADVESITLGIKSDNAITGGAANLAREGIPDPLQAAGDLSKLRNQEFSGVVRLTKPLDLAGNAKLKEEAERVSYNEATYYREKSKDGQPGEQCLYMPTPNIAVICSREEILKSLIDVKGKSKLRAEFDFIDPAQHFSFSLMIPSDSAGGPPAADASEDDPLAPFKKVQGGSLGIIATDGITLSLRQLCADSKNAEEVQQGLNDLLAKGKASLADLGEMLPKNVVQIADALVAGAKVSRRDRLVETASVLPATMRENLKAAPAELFRLWLGGGVAGPGTNNPNFSHPSASQIDEPQGAASVANQLDGLPEGVTVEASARWAAASYSEKDDSVPRPLEVEIKFLGDLADKAIQAGNVRLTKLAAEPPQFFKVAQRSPGDKNPYRGFSNLNGGSVRIHLEHPALPTSKFTQFEGEAILRCVTETKEIVIPNVVDQGGKPTDDPILKACGFAIAVDKNEDGSTTMKFHFESKAAVADVKLVDSKGEPLKSVPFLIRMELGEELDFIAPGDASKLPPGTAVKIQLRTKIEDVRVPFRFENLAVPAPPKAIQPSVLAWQHSHAAGEIPKGLAVHGRLHWSRVTIFDDDDEMQTVDALAMQVDVTGPPAIDIIACGFQKAGQAQAKPGPAVTFKPNAELSSADPSRQFVPRQTDSLTDHEPPDGVRAVFIVEPTPPENSKINRVTGSLKVLQAQGRKKAVFDKLTMRVGETLSNADLEAEGLELKLTVENDLLTLRVTKGNPYSVSDIVLIRDQPVRDKFLFQDESWHYDPAEKVGRTFLPRGRISEKDSLAVTISTGLSEIAIPFAFEDLVVPPRAAEDESE